MFMGTSMGKCEEEIQMTTARDPRVTHRVDRQPDLPVEDHDTSFSVWTHTTMLGDDTTDDLSDTTVLRGID
jgi:hypothetical protein